MRIQTSNLVQALLGAAFLAGATSASAFTLIELLPPKSPACAQQQSPTGVPTSSCLSAEQAAPAPDASRTRPLPPAAGPAQHPSAAGSMVGESKPPQPPQPLLLPAIQTHRR